MREGSCHESGNTTSTEVEETGDESGLKSDHQNLPQMRASVYLQSRCPLCFGGNKIHDPSFGSVNILLINNKL